MCARVRSSTERELSPGRRGSSAAGTRSCGRGPVRSMQTGLSSPFWRSTGSSALASSGSNCSIVPKPRVVVTGPYRSIRHPMYLAESSCIAERFEVIAYHVRHWAYRGFGLQVYRNSRWKSTCYCGLPQRVRDFIARTRYPTSRTCVVARWIFSYAVPEPSVRKRRTGNPLPHR